MGKGSIGGIIILGGIAFIGFVWFKKNKPQLSEKQLSDLTTKSNSIQAGAIDKPFEDYKQSIYNNTILNPNAETLWNNRDLTPKQIQEFKDNVLPVLMYDYSTIVTNQIAEGVNADYGQFNLNFGVDKVNWSNLKIK